MAAVHLQTVVADDGTLTVKGLPSLAGHRVDVIVSDRDDQPKTEPRYPLRGKLAKYRDPFESVAEDEWDALR